MTPLKGLTENGTVPDFEEGGAKGTLKFGVIYPPKEPNIA